MMLPLLAVLCLGRIFLIDLRKFSVIIYCCWCELRLNSCICLCMKSSSVSTIPRKQKVSSTKHSQLIWKQTIKYSIVSYFCIKDQNAPKLIKTSAKEKLPLKKPTTKLTISKIMYLYIRCIIISQGRKNQNQSQKKTENKSRKPVTQREIEIS